MTRQVGAVLTAVVALAAVAGHRSATASPVPAAARVVAIGDIHGDLDALTAILKRAGLVDNALKWTGQNATLVQLGDMIDRGSKSRAVMDLLRLLQRDAPGHGGRVVVLLGDHETMNIYGDVGFVTAADDATFADGESEHRRQSAYEAYAALRRRDSQALRAEWMTRHPLGFIEHRSAMGPDGVYGKWLRTLPAVARIDDSIFVHGGISQAVASRSLENINETIAGEIRTFDTVTRILVREHTALPFFTLEEMAKAAAAAIGRGVAGVTDIVHYDSWLSVRDDGPLWFRGYARWSDAEGAEIVARETQSYRTARFIVGHTTQSGSIVPRFDGRVFLIDTGMLSGFVPGGRASALELRGGAITTIYADRPTPQ